MKIDRFLILLALVLTLASARPAAAHHTPGHPVCAPVSYCNGTGCYYELLNNPEFIGTPASCTPWVGASVTTSAACFNDPSAVLSPSTPGFTQNFTVPADTADNLEISVEYAAPLAAPTSLNDRIFLELWEGPFLRGRKTIRPFEEPTYCHRKNFVFYGTYAGSNLQLRVKGLFATPGVQYHINWVQLWAYVN